MSDRLTDAWRGVRWTLARVIAIFALAATTACVHQDTAGPQPADTCCIDVERQPAWLVAMAEPFAPALGWVIGHIAWREGHLSDSQTQARIVSDLQPLDIVFVSSKGRMSGHTIPGLFQHAAVYIGSERQLRALGMWSHASVLPHRDAIRRGAVFIEADLHGVHLSPPAVVLNTDRVVTTRPRVATPRWRQRATATLFGELGKPFDFSFDASLPDRVFCAELVCRAIPELRLPRTIVYGRETIIPDRLAYEAALGRSRLSFGQYVIGDSRGSRTASRDDLAEDIRVAWPD